jgi:hypothetical protein
MKQEEQKEELVETFFKDLVKLIHSLGSESFTVVLSHKEKCYLKGSYNSLALDFISDADKYIEINKFIIDYEPKASTILNTILTPERKSKQLFSEKHHFITFKLSKKDIQKSYIDFVGEEYLDLKTIEKERKQLENTLNNISTIDNANTSKKIIKIKV